MVLSTVFQSSFELTGYITNTSLGVQSSALHVSKLFRAYRLYNKIEDKTYAIDLRFKALSSLQVI